MSGEERLVPPRTGNRKKVKVLPQFNFGRPFTLLNTPRGKGILKRRRREDDSLLVWVGHELEETTFQYSEVEVYILKDVSTLAYEEEVSTIGGLGKHMRWRINYPNRSLVSEKAVLVVLVGEGEEERLEKVVESVYPHAFLRGEEKDEERRKGEDGKTRRRVDVPDAQKIGVVSAAFQEEGFRAEPEEERYVTRSKLGIERYDRTNHMWWNQEALEAGPLRDVHRWNFSFLPEEWKSLPFTWESMAENLASSSNLDSLPQPLRSHVQNATGEKGKEDCDEKQLVTCRLSFQQNKQLLTSSYWDTVAPFDEERVLFSRLIRFRYMLHGYTSRELGAYNQTARYLGHGAYIRTFRGKEQYKVENIHPRILNNIYQMDGSLKGAGFKGTRGKYGHADFPEYVPKKRMKRTSLHEFMMRQGQGNILLPSCSSLSTPSQSFL